MRLELSFPCIVLMANRRYTFLPVELVYIEREDSEYWYGANDRTSRTGEVAWDKGLFSILSVEVVDDVNED